MPTTSAFAINRPSPFSSLGGFGNFVARYVAGDSPVTELSAYSWPAQMNLVKNWLADVGRDIEMPDLWDGLLRQTELLEGVSEETLENTPFTPGERDEILRQLNQVREYAKDTYALSEPQLTDLDAKLDYLVEAASRLGRKD